AVLDQLPRAMVDGGGGARSRRRPHRAGALAGARRGDDLGRSKLTMHERWQGWRAAATPSAAGWRDLSHPLRADLARIAFLPAARFERIMHLESNRVNVTEMQMVCHFGTHIDAPCHFIADGPAVHELPLDRLHGAGVVWRLACEPYQVIEPPLFEAARPALQ